MKKHLIACLAAAQFLPLSIAAAQDLPSAGSVREQITSQPPVPPKPVDFRLEGQPLLPVEQGGKRFRLEAVVVEGNTVISTEELQAAIAPSLGKDVDFGDLRAIANRISQLYRSRGYVFAKAALPAQDIVGGRLRVQVLEGRYGNVTATVGGEAQEVFAPYFRGLRPGEVIRSEPLERTALLLAGLPGYDVVPVVRPGAAVGTGDLDVVVKETPRYLGSVRLDNHGGDLTGTNRVLFNVARFRNWVPGDQLQLDALVSDGSTNLFNLQYSRPLGANGWRGNLGLSRSAYQLSGLDGFADGEFKGGSDVLTLGLSYPLVLGQRSSLTLQAALTLSRFKNTRPAAEDERYHATSLPVGLRFSQKDSVAGGGVSFGSATLTAGRITERANYLSPASLGSYAKLSLDMARVQNLPGTFSGYLRLATQHSGDVLDSSERMSAGGPNGVRAFASGEASGDRGLLAQVELRYLSPIEGLSPYLFVDAARMTRIDPEAGNSTRSLSGHGLGVRWQRDRLSADLTAAWLGQTGLEAPQAATLKNPRFWLTVNYAF